jgi:hypothetical protein
MHFLASQALVPASYSLMIATCYYGYRQSLLQCKMNGIPVLDIGTAYGLSVFADRYGRRAKHTIHIKGQKSDFT